MKEKKLYGIIYRARNILNNKVYIGQTIKTLRERKKEHIKCSEYTQYFDFYFYRSMRKYGSECFRWKIIDRAYSKNELNTKEKYWIKEYKSTNNRYGYNAKDGGNAGGSPNKSVRRKISIANKGRVCSEETKIKISKANSGRKQTKEEIEKRRISCTGKKRTKEFRELLRKLKTGKHLSEEHKRHVSEAQKGIPKHTEESKRKISEAVKGRIVSQETKDKISKANKGRNAGCVGFFKGHHHTKESIEKSRLAHLGSKASTETKKKMSLARIGKPLSKETRKRMSIAKHNVSVETREKLRQLNLGKTHSEYTKAKISKSKTGKPWSRARWDSHYNRKNKVDKN